MGLAAHLAAVEPADARSLDPELWEGVRRVVERAPTRADLRAHGVEPLAALAGRRHGREDGETQARVTAALSAPLLLRRIRAACDGRLMLFKGPEVAARYPHPSLRSFVDLDLLTDDADAVQRALLAAGFGPVGDERLYRDIHHLRPLHLEGFPFVVEVHERPKWPAGMEPPGTAELFASSVATSTGVSGVVSPGPAQHALLLAAHGWAHDPLGRLGSLVDVAAVRSEASDEEMEALALHWGIGRLWSATARAIDALFLGGPLSWPLRTWARHLPRARERTVLETHLQSWLSPFWASPPGPAARAGLGELWNDMRPAQGERASTKARRASLAVRHSLLRRSAHDEDVGRRSLDAPHPIFGREDE
jgi:hypothetical protein